MKKIIAAILAITTAVTLSACGSAPANKVFKVADLPGKTIGVQLGTTGDIYASDYEKQGSKISRFNNGNDAVLALKQGKVDCVIIDQEPAKSFVAKNDDLKILDDVFTKEEYAICVSKDHSDLTQSINKALAQLKADGTLKKIISNYIGDDTKGKYQYTSPANVSRTNGTLVMATNAEFEPYEYRDGNKVVGIDVDMAQAVADIMGKKLDVEDMEFDSIITAVQSGKANIGVAGMTITKDRLKNVDFTDPYAMSTQVIIVRKK
jgi:polar amino acid transport system substrate-binding protein